MVTKISKKRRLLAIFLCSVLALFLIPNYSYASTSTELQQQIDEQKKELGDTQNEINDLQNKIADSQTQINSLSDGLPKLSAQLDDINNQIDLSEKKLKLLQQQSDLKKSEKQKLELEQHEAVKSSYQQWRSQTDNFATKINLDDPIMRNMGTFYEQTVLGLSDSSIHKITLEIDALDSQISDSTNSIDSLNQQKKDLEAKKKQIEDQIAYYNSQLFSGSSDLSNLQKNAEKIQGNISFLSAEQQAAYREEAALAAQSGTGGASVGNCGLYDDANYDSSIVFCGIGNDFVQGHGTGMSQWGAHGMANSGFAAADILRFYYTGVDLQSGNENRTVNVEGYGSINIEDYVAGEGEVPGKACGNQDQVNQNSSKYALDNGSGWSCWPEEAIKAQAIAFRTYGAYNAGFVHNDARSQVYNGSHYAQWAAYETKGQVITYGGQIIEALYSADNSQGFGTANNDTMFQNYDGNGDAIPYLRSVNDRAFATQTSYTNWTYESKKYSMNDILDMMNWFINNRGGDFGNYLQGVKNSIGGVRPMRLSFERDPSNRVKKDWLLGSNGNSSVIGGWWLTYMWNVYSSNN